MALIELRKSREQLAAVLRNAIEAIITIDLRGMIIQANPAAEQMFGYPSSELIGQNVKMLMPSPHRERHDHYITLAISAPVSEGSSVSDARSWAVARTDRLFPSI